jgi:hypothetical protein
MVENEVCLSSWEWFCFYLLLKILKFLGFRLRPSEMLLSFDSVSRLTSIVMFLSLYL